MKEKNDRESKGFKYYLGIILINYKLLLGIVLAILIIVVTYKVTTKQDYEPSKVDIETGQEDLIEPYGNRYGSTAGGVRG